MVSIAQKIRQKALELGYEKCGIISVEKLGGYKEKLEERIQKIPESGGFYQGQQRLVKFQEEFPWAKSVVVLAVPYCGYHIPKVVRGHIAKKYLLDIRIDENTKEYQNSTAFEKYINELGIRTATNRKFGVVGLRWAAMQAGLGLVRRNNFFYTESGSYVNIEAFLTDRDMELIETAKLPPCPPNCDRCIKACPTASLCEAYTMNPLKCVSFLTTFGGRDLTKEPLAAKFGDWIYGCDVCQDVCPMNHQKWIGNEEFPGLAELSDTLTVEHILRMDEQYYRERIQPKFFYLAPDELWKWQINALNYMDNVYEEKYRTLVLEARSSAYPKVRDMANTISQKHGLL